MAITSAGAIQVDLRANAQPLMASADRAATKVRGMFSGLGKVLGATMGVAALASFTKGSLDAASALTEVQNVVDVTFPTMSAKMDAWAKGAAESFGLSELMAKQYAGRLGAMAEASGIAEQSAYEMGTSIAELAGDVASFYNIGQDEAYEKLTSIFTGQVRPLMELGVVMNQTTLDAYAMSHGFGMTTSEMDAAGRAALRYQFVMDALSNTSGDFARTQGSWANQTRLLQLRWESFKATIGQGMIAALLPVVRGLNAIMTAAIAAANAFNRFIEAVTGKKMAQLVGGATSAGVAIGGMGDASDSAAGSSDGLADSQGRAAKAAKAQDRAQRELNRTLAGFDKINKLAANSNDLGASGGSGGAGGIGGGGGGISSLGGIQEAAEGAQAALDKLELPESLVKAFGRLGDAVDRFVGIVRNGLQWAYDNVLVPLGKWTIEEFVPDAVNLLADAIGHLSDFLEDVSDPLQRFIKLAGENLKYAYDHVLKPFGDWIVNQAAPKFLDAAAAAFDVVVTCLEKLQPVAEAIWEDFVEPIAGAVGDAVVMVLGKIGDGLKWLADKLKGADFSEFIENLHKLSSDIGKVAKPAFDKLGDAAKWVWEKVLKPMGGWLADNFPKLLDAAQDVLDDLGEAFGKVSDACKWVWDNVLEPFGKWMSDKFGKAVDAARPILDGLRDVFEKLGYFGGLFVDNVLRPVAKVMGIELPESADKSKTKLSEVATEMAKFPAKKDVKLSATDSTKAGTDAAKKGIGGVKGKTVDLTARNYTEKDGKGKPGGLAEAITSLTKFTGKTVTLGAKRDKSLWWSNEGGEYRVAMDYMGKFKNKTVTLGAKMDKSLWRSNNDGDYHRAMDYMGKFKNKTVTLGAKMDKSLWRSNNDGDYHRAMDYMGKFKNKTVTLGAALGKSMWYSNTSGAYRTARDYIDKFKGKTVRLNLEVHKTGIKGINVKSKAAGGGWYAEAYAQGGFVERNTPRLAIVGDNTREGEIISPESKFQTMLDKAVAQGGSQRTEALLVELIGAVRAIEPGVYLDGREITRRVVSGINQQTSATGRSPLIV